MHLIEIPLCRLTLQPNLEPSANLLGMHSILFSVTLLKMLNKINSNSEFQETPFVIHHQLDFSLFKTIL